MPRRLIVIIALVAVCASWPVGADPAPLACAGAASGGPIVGDGVGVGDATTDASPLTFGCYDARLQRATDVDGYRVLATPVRVAVMVADGPDCLHATWFQGPPPSNAIARWLCGGEGHEVAWYGTHPMRVQLWYGPGAQPAGPTTYVVRVLPAT